jgi:4-hydroxy-3-methylbut-2-en-1-yl diphosphate reductase
MHAQRVVLIEPRGFCAGVEMAIKALGLMVMRFGAPVYCVHYIVHNDNVVARFQRLGVRFVERVEDVPIGAAVLLSAHGTAPASAAVAAARAAIVIDSACPLVTKVHHEIAHQTAAGYDVLYVGHDGHDETVGALGVAPANTTLVRTPDDVASLAWPRRPVAVLAQTTLAVDEWTAVVDAATTRFGEVWTARREDVCYATTNRQAAVRAVAADVDVVLVVGSASSANTRALVHTARRAGAPRVLRVDGADDLDEHGGVGSVAVTAGASTPEQPVRDIVAALRPDLVERVAPVDERDQFPLPRPLRWLLANDDDGASLLQLAHDMTADELLCRIETAMAARAA